MLLVRATLGAIVAAAAVPTATTPAVAGVAVATAVALTTRAEPRVVSGVDGGSLGIGGVAATAGEERRGLSSGARRLTHLLELQLHAQGGEGGERLLHGVK